MKYYCITAYTCFVGETLDAYFAVPDGESIESDKWVERCYDVVCDCAMEWWDDEAREMFDDDYGAYLGDCGYDAVEIDKEEYERWAY